jgi:hypothetical protein
MALAAKPAGDSLYKEKSASAMKTEHRQLKTASPDFPISPEPSDLEFSLVVC